MKITIDRDTAKRLHTYIIHLWGPEPPEGRELRVYLCLTWRQEKRRALREMLALEKVMEVA